jgi:hypothetical protein
MFTSFINDRQPVGKNQIISSTHGDHFRWHMGNHSIYDRSSNFSKNPRTFWELESTQPIFMTRNENTDLSWRSWFGIIRSTQVG